MGVPVWKTSMPTQLRAGGLVFIEECRFGIQVPEGFEETTMERMRGGEPAAEVAATPR